MWNQAGTPCAPPPAPRARDGVCFPPGILPGTLGAGGAASIPTATIPTAAPPAAAPAVHPAAWLPAAVRPAVRPAAAPISTTPFHTALLLAVHPHPAAVLLPAVVETTENQKTLEYQFAGTRRSGGQHEDSVVAVGCYRVRVRREAVPATSGGANQRGGGPPWPPSLASIVPPGILPGPLSRRSNRTRGSPSRRAAASKRRPCLFPWPPRPAPGARLAVGGGKTARLPPRRRASLRNCAPSLAC